jgi:antitoxin component HigA of HigAB toxin-antitoxin module
MGEMMKELKPIHNDAEYESALAEASLLTSATFEEI